LRDHGVSSEFVRDVVALGYGDTTPSDIVRLRDHGVTPQSLRRAKALGGKLKIDDLVRLRDSGTI